MSDEDETEHIIVGPQPSPEWLARRQRHIIADADAADRQREAQALADMMAGIREISERTVAQFAILPCRGSIERIGDCADAFALTCDRRESPSCPRRIRAYDDDLRRERVRQRLAESQLSEEDRARVRKCDLGEEALSTLLRMVAADVDLGPALTVVSREFRATRGTMAVDEFLAKDDMLTLVIAGDIGVGKSVAAAYGMRQRRGRFVSSSALTEMARFGDENDARRKAAFATPLLVLDDVGVEKEWVAPLVESLLVERHNQQRRTVLTTNLDVKAFAKHYKGRVADRISSAGMFIPLLGPSLRKRGA